MIRFYKKRFVFLAVSLSIFLIGVIAYFINGVQLDIQFTGGSIIKYEFVGKIDTDKADDVISKTLDGRLANCQITTDIATKTKYLTINLAGTDGLSAEDQTKLDEVLKKEYSDSNLKISETKVVEPFLGKRFFKNGITAIVLSFVLIMIYVWIRFSRIGGLSAGTMAIVALIHDVTVVFIAFIVFRIPINENFVAAALTIIGFSINDTIVIYDRIRENAKLVSAKTSTEELVDLSITQSMTRSINTNLATFVAISIVFVFSLIYGIESIRTFALPMMFGVVSGCYSTICIAGPLWVAWKNHKDKKLKSAKA